MKINTVLSYGGIGCVVKTVEELTGVTIPFAGIVQFLGVAGLSEAVGGVEVCVAEPIEDEYTGPFLDAGNHTLSGIAALQFLRTRHGVGDGSDLGPHLEPAGVPLVARAHAAVRRHARRPGEALLDRQGGAREHAALRQPHGPNAHDLDREGAEGHRPREDRVHPVPDRIRRGRRSGRAERIGAATSRTALQNDLPVSFDPEPRRPIEFGTVGGPQRGAARRDSGRGGTRRGDADRPLRRRPSRRCPSDVTGQTAAETRCSAGRTLDDQ